MKLQISKINKFYKQLHVLKELDLELHQGICGLVGPNGAGKSTLIRLLVAAEKPSSGKIFLNDSCIEEQLDVYRMKLGYLPQEFGFYKEFTGREMLTYTGLIKTKLPFEKIQAQVEELLDWLDLKDKADVAVGKYSGGMKQRLGIAQAFLGNPDIVILDEATVGLDPMQRIKFKSFLKAYGENRIIILSTHIMSDLQEIADQLVFLKEGQIVFEGMVKDQGNLDELYMQYFGDGVVV